MSYSEKFGSAAAFLPSGKKASSRPCTMEKGQKTTAAVTDPYLCYLYPTFFTHVLLSRINPLLKSRRRPQQSGFTAGKSTTDAILALRLLSELHREFDRPLHVAYVDLKSTFDSVDRQALWKALGGTGIP